jgi:hypothetical protein
MWFIGVAVTGALVVSGIVGAMIEADWIPNPKWF